MTVQLEPTGTAHPELLMRLGWRPGSLQISEPGRADLANGFTNNGPGRAWILLEPITVHMPYEQVRPTSVDDPGRFESCYGSEGWGFESLRARHVMSQDIEDTVNPRQGRGFDRFRGFPGVGPGGRPVGW